jgi:hypothetical protein
LILLRGSPSSSLGSFVQRSAPLLAPSRSSIRPSEIRGVYKGIVRLQVPELAELTRDHFCSMGWNVTAMGRQKAHANWRWEHDWGRQTLTNSNGK